MRFDDGYLLFQELEEFWAYHALYERFIKKFSLCVKPELIALMELPGVKIVSVLLVLVQLYIGVSTTLHWR